jgi:hypothetical protein
VTPLTQVPPLYGTDGRLGIEVNTNAGRNLQASSVAVQGFIEELAERYGRGLVPVVQCDDRGVQEEDDDAMSEDEDVEED